MNRSNASALAAKRRPSLPVVAATVAGVAGGVAIGAMTGPVGAGIGVVLGIGIGILAGKTMARDEAIAVARTRELDAIVGITQGSMGAAPVSFPPHGQTQEDDGGPSGDEWLGEWLTPPPPKAMG